MQGVELLYYGFELFAIQLVPLAQERVLIALWLFKEGQGHLIRLPVAGPMPDLESALQDVDPLRRLFEGLLYPVNPGASDEKVILDGGPLDVADACDVAEEVAMIGRAPVPPPSATCGASHSSPEGNRAL